MLGKLRDLFFNFPDRLDSWLRWRDLDLNRINDTPVHRKGLVESYSQLALWLPLPVLAILAYGMPAWRGRTLLLAVAASLVAYVVLARFARSRQLPRLLWMLAAVVAGASWQLAGAGSIAAAPLPYRHLFGLIGVIALTLAIPASRWLADAIVGQDRRQLRAMFGSQLAHTQLFLRPYHPPHSAGRVCRAFILVPLTSPLLLVLFPSLVAILARVGTVWPLFGVTLALTWALLAAGHYNERLTSFRRLLRQMFLVGAPTLVSLIAIVLAAARLAGISYVAIVLDQATWTVIVSLMLIFYLIGWLYDYWLQRAVAEVLLGLLHDGDAHPSRIPYRNGAKLQIHGAGRLIALDESTPGKTVFESYRPLDLFRRIQVQMTGRARAGKLSWRAVDDAAEGLAALTQRSRLYAAVPAVVLSVLAAWATLSLAQREQWPGLEASTDAALEQPFDLASALAARQPADGSIRGPSAAPHYAIAFSGGGTRAALYAYSVLRALNERNALDRLLLISSVSGGSAGAAYFAAHRRTLLTAAGNWDAFREAMAAEYLLDVLSGVGEWRFAQGMRLGQLLTESFERNFTSPPSPRPDCLELSCVAAQGPPMGVIFNSSVGGSWTANNEQSAACRAAGGTARDCASIASAGSRLVITNIAALTAASAATTTPGWPLDFRYAVVKDPAVPLTTAASLSANFPPIFPNAEVRLSAASGASRYWVTDGGAVENRGLLSLLLALRAELHALGGKAPPGGLPPLRILVAEASGSSFGYHEDRGLGARSRSASRITNKLVAELSRQVQRGWHKLSDGETSAEIVYLPMPTALTSSFGTNWELPKRITVSDPSSWFSADRQTITLDEENLRQLADLLFASNAERSQLALQPSDQVPLLWSWLTNDPGGDVRDLLDAAALSKWSDLR